MKQYLYFAVCFLLASKSTMATEHAPDSRRAVIEIDCSKSIGKMNPMLNGVNGGWLAMREYINLYKRWEEIGIPITRLHDIPWTADEAVDIRYIFPDMSKDASDEKNYSFLPTDDFIQPIVTGSLEQRADLPTAKKNTYKTKILYRLGESIQHSRRKEKIYPPLDYEKWSDVCLGIIKHYNEGWADGYHDDIKYWEIWNEPDIRYENNTGKIGPSQWKGTDEDYYRLYEVASLRIKQSFPNLKVGGPATSGQGKFENGEFVVDKFQAGFMALCKAKKLPFDFYSWHTYTGDPSEYKKKAIALRAWLDMNGYGETELILDEWNGGGDAGQDHGGVSMTGFAGFVLTSLLDSPLDGANYYCADTNPWSMFDNWGKPRKTFYAFKAFRMLLDTPVLIEVKEIEAGKSIYAAGKNEENSEVTIMLSNYQNPKATYDFKLSNLPWSGNSTIEVFVVDEKYNLECKEKHSIRRSLPVLTIKSQTSSVVVVKIKKF